MNQKKTRQFTPTGIPGILAMTDLSVNEKDLYGYLVYADTKELEMSRKVEP